MEQIREVKKSFCALSVAYIVLGLALLIWPDISMQTFCYVFGAGMIIFGCVHIVMYFTKDKLQSVMQMDMVSGIIGIATGAYILLKMESMLEMIPFVLGIAALLGAVVKLQYAFDLKRFHAKRWYLMLIIAAALLALGVLLVANPFEEMLSTLVILIGVSLLTDGLGNLLSIFWIGHLIRKRKNVSADTQNRADQNVAVEITASDPNEVQLPAQTPGGGNGE